MGSTIGAATATRRIWMGRIVVTEFVAVGRVSGKGGQEQI
jgi:hypothetical protein